MSQVQDGFFITEEYNFMLSIVTEEYRPSVVGSSISSWTFAGRHVIMQTVRHIKLGLMENTEDCFIPKPGATMKHQIFHLNIVTTDY